jgi:hypothetical protein
MCVYFADFFNENFFQGLVGNGIANVLAVILGIPAGLYLQHLITSRSGERNREQMRGALKRALEHNLGTLATVREQLQNGGGTTVMMDLALLDATAAAKYDVLEDIPLCASIDHLRFEMAHLDRQLDALLRLQFDAMAHAEGNFVEGRKPSLYSQMYPQLVHSITERLPPLERECQEILAKIGA